MRMKVKAAPHSSNVVIEMRPSDSSMPATPLPELRLKKILVPVDFSEPSRKAMAYATSFAKQFNAELLLFHAVPIMTAPAPMYSIPLETDARLREESSKQLAQWRSALPAELSSKAIIGDGASAYAQIVQTATENNVDLIILGTHGRTGAARWLIGSTAERVVRYAACPVLVVREREHDFIAEQKNGSTFAE